MKYPSINVESSIDNLLMGNIEEIKLLQFPVEPKFDSSKQKKYTSVLILIAVIVILIVLKVKVAWPYITLSILGLLNCLGISDFNKKLIEAYKKKLSEFEDAVKTIERINKERTNLANSLENPQEREKYLQSKYKDYFKRFPSPEIDTFGHTSFYRNDFTSFFTWFIFKYFKDYFRPCSKLNIRMLVNAPNNDLASHYYPPILLQVNEMFLNIGIDVNNPEEKSHHVYWSNFRHNWVAITFHVEQVLSSPCECCKFIESFICRVYPDFPLSKELSSFNDLITTDILTGSVDYDQMKEKYKSKDYSKELDISNPLVESNKCWLTYIDIYEGDLILMYNHNMNSNRFIAINESILDDTLKIGNSYLIDLKDYTKQESEFHYKIEKIPIDRDTYSLHLMQTGGRPLPEKYYYSSVAKEFKEYSEPILILSSK